MALKDWKKTNSFKGRFNQEGGLQQVIEYRNKKENMTLEVVYTKTPNGFKSGKARVRNHSWPEGAWKTLDEYWDKDYAEKTAHEAHKFMVAN